MSTSITEAKDVSKVVTTLCSFCFAFVHWYFGVCAVSRRDKSNAKTLSSSLCFFQLLCKCSHKSRCLNLSFIISTTVHSNTESNNSGVTNCILKASFT